MQNRGFIDSSDDAEKIVAEQNEITVLDESIPSPAEIQTDETIVLPEIVSMPEYIRRHYEKDLIHACINQINDLTLCVMYDGKFFHDVPGLGPIDSGEEKMILTDGPTPLEWGEPKSFPFDRNVYSATIRPIDGAITWIMDSLLEKGLITKQEYRQIERILGQKFSPVWARLSNVMKDKTA